METIPRVYKFETTAVKVSLYSIVRLAAKWDRADKSTKKMCNSYM